MGSKERSKLKRQLALMLKDSQTEGDDSVDSEEDERSVQEIVSKAKQRLNKNKSSKPAKVEAKSPLKKKRQSASPPPVKKAKKAASEDDTDEDSSSSSSSDNSDSSSGEESNSSSGATVKKAWADIRNKCE